MNRYYKIIVNNNLDIIMLNPINEYLDNINISIDILNKSGYYVKKDSKLIGGHITMYIDTKCNRLEKSRYLIYKELMSNLVSKIRDVKINKIIRNA